MTRKLLPWMTGGVSVLLFIGAFMLQYAAEPPKATPERIHTQTTSPLPSHSSTAAMTPPTPQETAIPSSSVEPVGDETQPSAEPTLTIPASDILSLQLPAVGIDVKASGETWPRQSTRCRGGGAECIDPPVFREVAWYGAYARPSLPSEDSVLIFGHTNWYDEQNQAFNNLPATNIGDTVIVTTGVGVFTYTVNAVELVPYEQVPYSELIYGHQPDKLVMVTCNDESSAGTVVTALLSSATLS